MNHRITCATGLAAIVLAGASAFAAEDKDVRVVNTPAQRIPVDATGTVALAPGAQVGVVGPVTLNPATAQVGVAGFVHLAPFTGPVTLAPTTEVSVANTAASPLHVVTPAAGPDVFVRSATIELAENAGIGHAFIEVPPGKRLVIEQVAGRMEDAAGMDVDFIFEFWSGGGTAAFHYATEGRRTTGIVGLHYIFSAPLRAYHDGGHELRVLAVRSGNAPPAVAVATISGYLINVP